MAELADPSTATVGTDVTAERAVLGSMMASPGVIPEVALKLKSSDFWSSIHRELYDILLSRHMRGEPIDEIAIASVLAGMPGGNQHQSFLSKIGGAAYLHTLMASVTIPASAPFYAEEIRKRAVRREMDVVASQIGQMTRSGLVEPDELADRAVHLIRSSSLRSNGRAVDFRTACQHAAQYMDEEASGGGISTGFYRLEEMIGKPRAGQLIVIAGRPGSGKTVFAASIARNVAIRQHVGVLYATLEMSIAEMAMRTMSAECSINYTRLRDRKPTEADRQRMNEVYEKHDGVPFYTVDIPHLSVLDFCSEFHYANANADVPVGAGIFDYLQLAKTNSKLQSRQEQVAELSRDFKLAAKELGIPLFVVAQLNRGPEQRTDKRPQLSDLRESGAVEQDADVVIMVHRPDYYDEFDRPGEADLMVVKNRHGPTGTVAVRSQLEYMRFMNLVV